MRYMETFMLIRVNRFVSFTHNRFSWAGNLDALQRRESHMNVGMSVSSAIGLFMRWGRSLQLRNILTHRA